MSPELPTPAEIKALDHLVDLQIDEAIEEKHLHEIDTNICETCGHPLHPLCNGGNCDKEKVYPEEADA